MKLFLRVPVGMLLTVITSCGGPTGGDGNDNGNGQGNGGTTPPSTKVLTTTALQSLQSVNADLSILTFAGSNSQLAGIRIGDIIVSDVFEPLLPNGALRKVVGVSRSTGGIVFTTEAVGLAQAVETGQIHTRIPLALPEGSTDGKIQTRSLGTGQLVFAFNDVVLYDGDGNEDGIEDQIVMNGSMTLEPEIIIDIEIDNFTLQKAAIEIVGNISTSITIEARRQATFAYEDILIAIPFPKVVVPIGPIPVVLLPILEIRGGASGSFSAGMSTDLELQADTRVGLGYDGSFGPVLDVDPSGSAGVPSFGEGATADGEAWLSAKFKVAVYGLAGVFVESKFYGRVHVGVDECPWWSLYAGVSGSAGAYAGISVEFLIFDQDITIFEWQTDPLKEEKKIAEASGCAPSSSQQDITWARSYGAESLDFPVAVAATSDGGAVVAGVTYSFTPGTVTQDAFLIKTDRFGNVAWQMGYDDLAAAIAVVPIVDGYYLLAGEHTVSEFLSPFFLPSEFRSQAGDPPWYVLRLDLNGTPIWAKAYAASDPIDPAAMALLPNGDLVVAGTIGDPPDGEDVWVARLNSSGDIAWSRRLDRPMMDEGAESLIVDSDGDILVLASDDSGQCDWTIKLDGQGQMIWQFCYGGAHNNWPSQIVEVPGGYMTVGDLDNHGQINRIDQDGGLLWAIHIDSDVIKRDPDTGRELTPDLTPYDKLFGAATMPDGDVLVVGKRDLGENADFWAIRIKDTGSAEWMRAYGGARRDEAGGFSEFSTIASPIAATPDGGALIAGYTTSFSHAPDSQSFDADTWVIKIRGIGTLDINSGSGAFSAAVNGEIDNEVLHTRFQTSAELAPIDLLVAQFTPVVFSPTFDSVRQGGPP